MRLRKADGTVVDTPNDRQLQLRDVKPGQVFRYVRGHEDNLYVMGTHGRTFHLNGNVSYDGTTNSPSSPVIVYPDATIDLGEEQRELPEGEERSTVGLRGLSMRQWDNEPIDFDDVHF